MLTGIFLALILVMATFWFHYRVLRAVSALIPKLRLGLELRVLVVISIAFAAHVVEALAYGAGYKAGEMLSLGALAGPITRDAMDYFYYSMTSYTSLGLGDIAPTRHLRFLTGVESLNGLLLITWSASYTYLAMGRLWPWRPCD